MPSVALLTPPGRGGVAVLQVRGPDARSRVREIFRGRWPCPGGIAYGAIADLDDGVVVDLGDVVEVTVHGNPVLVERLIDRLGSREEFRPEGDAIQQEAMSLLPHAPTLLGVRVLADQARGALSQAIREGRDVLATARFGISLVEAPPRVVLTGRTNVGKSTLFNALVRRERVLVSSEPGTTRDPVREWISIEGIPIQLVDTAGDMAPRSETERAALERAGAERERADLLVHVREAGDEAIGFSVVNKCDLRHGDRLNVSALTGEGLDDLRAAILRELGVAGSHVTGAPVVFTRRQRDLLLRRASAGEILRPCDPRDSVL